jgi:outer membrane protein TolC
MAAFIAPSAAVKWLASALSLLFMLAIPHLAWAAIRVSPQLVVDRVLAKSTAARTAALDSEKFQYSYEQALGVFDFQLSGAVGYEHNEAQTLSGNNNPIDRTFNYNVTLAKRMRTGTTLSLGFDSISQNSTLSSFSATTRSPDASLDAVTFTLRQSLLQNAFGYADRMALRAEEELVKSAEDLKMEGLEGVALDGLTLFWNAYIAEQSFKANISAREKYDQLVKNVRRKAGFNLSAPGELPRLEAEFGQADSKVKSASAAYLTSIDSLFTAMKLEHKPGDEIEFDVPDELPPVPQLRPKAVEELRLIKVARTTVESADRTLRAVRNQNIPKLDFVARAKSTGVDEERSRAIAEMTSGGYPTYFIGVEFATALDSSLARGKVGAQQLQLEVAKTTLEKQTDGLKDILSALERQVASNYAVAKEAGDVVKARERVVRDYEASYRQGRQPLSELIRAYNELFTSQLDHARAVGQYHIALDQFAAARDELIPNGSGAK